MISRNTIEEIKSRVDIVDVISDFLSLKRSGQNYKALSPFNNEKTASFFVVPAKGIFKDFSSGKGGDAITFVMEHEGMSYTEALKFLAKKYGVEIKEDAQSDTAREQQSEREGMYILMNFAKDYYKEKLFQSDEGRGIGMSYFHERGFNDRTIQKFELGYALEGWSNLSDEAVSKNYSKELLEKTGLVVKNEEGRTYDRFRGRVVFPVHHITGKVIAFGARMLGKEKNQPKYINSPETDIYHKGQVLYGLFQAKNVIRQKDNCFLVEGYTDVISLHQAGIENVVASGGTSLTIDQLRLVKKYTNNLTIVYDGDAAGIKAALRGLDLALEEGLSVKLVLIPDKEDPDSYVNKVGPTAFRDFVQKNKKDFILFQLEVALTDAGNDSAKKSEVVNRMAETISKINKVEDFTKQQDYIKQCSEILKIEESGLHALVNKFIRDRISTLERKLPFDEAKQQEENARQAEQTNYDDATFNLLFKDELQEREVARILLEYGIRKWDDSKLIAEHIFEEMVDESLIDNSDVIRLIAAFKELLLQDRSAADKNYFIYHPDTKLSTLAVSLLNFPYEESDHWRREFSQASGYQKNLFEQSYEDFIKTVAPDNEEKLMGFLKMDEDKTNEEIDSAIGYLKLRKIKRMLLENQLDLEKQHSPEEYSMLHQTHEHLKKMEMELTRKMGTVIIR